MAEYSIRIEPPMARSPAGPRKSQGPRGPAVTRAPRGADRHQRPPTGPLSVTADRSHTHERRPNGALRAVRALAPGFAGPIRSSRPIPKRVEDRNGRIANARYRDRARYARPFSMAFGARPVGYQIRLALRARSRSRVTGGCRERHSTRLRAIPIPGYFRLGTEKHGSAPRNTARHRGIRLGTAEYGATLRTTARHCGARRGS